MSHANNLFSRDLKHFVDAGHAVRAARKRRGMLTLAAGAGVVASAFAIGSLLIHLIGESTDAGHAGNAPQEPASGPIAARDAESAAPPKESADSTGSVPSRGRTAALTAAPDEGIEAADGPARAAGIRWSDYEIKRGDSLSRIFLKQKLSAKDALRIAAHEDAADIQTLIPGRKLRIGRDENSRLRAISFELRNNTNLNVILGTDGSLEFDSVKPDLDTRRKTVELIIDSSLFKAASDAGLSDKLILKLAGIFGWDIDFAKDLQKNDRFSIVHEELVDGATRKGDGKILAARYRGRDRELFAFRHVTERGRVEYFDEQGRNLRGTFLRTPMKISRVTSGFSKRRLHPISKEWKQHKGVDYAAPKGTPVLATANGSVSFLGKRNGYGKTVVLKHANRYSTLYAHLSSWKSKIRTGSRVEQGQIIGFVGQSGSATAPHLHYEFRVNGTHVDPLRYDLPKAESVADSHREAFLEHARELKADLVGESRIQLARNESD